MATFHLQIVTPDRMAFDGEAERIMVRTVNGDVSILAHHIDYAAALGIGVAKVIDDKGNVREAACNSGMLSVYNGEVRVMATTFEWADEIDAARAQRSLERAQAQAESSKQDKRALTLAEARAKRALTRLKAHG